MTDEPLIRPVSTGSVLMRLAQVEGALKRHDVTSLIGDLNGARAELLIALENADRARITTAVQTAQERLRQIHQSLCADDANSATLVACGFPVTGGDLSAVDVASVVVTYAKPKKQVTTTISFEDAAGATGYWLHEITDLPNDEEIQDALVSSYTPLFPRVRLPIGRHRLQIESRNLNEHRLSAEFIIQVPDL